MKLFVEATFTTYVAFDQHLSEEDEAAYEALETEEARREWLEEYASDIAWDEAGFGGTHKELEYIDWVVS